jgi:hypothetical protein
MDRAWWLPYEELALRSPEEKAIVKALKFYKRMVPIHPE